MVERKKQIEINGKKGGKERRVGRSIRKEKNIYEAAVVLANGSVKKKVLKRKKAFLGKRR